MLKQRQCHNRTMLQIPLPLVLLLLPGPDVNADAVVFVDLIDAKHVKETVANSSDLDAGVMHKDVVADAEENLNLNLLSQLLQFSDHLMTLDVALIVGSDLLPMFLRFEVMWAMLETL